MNKLITVKIDPDDMVEMLYERVQDWPESVPYGALDTWYAFYEDRVYNGEFDDSEFSVKYIVDNDVVNYYNTFTAEEFKDEYGIDPTDSEAMEDFDHFVFTYEDDGYYIVG